MKLNDEQIREVSSIIARHCRRSAGLYGVPIEDGEQEVMFTVLHRLSSKKGLDAPLSHFVNRTARPEALGLYSRRKRQRDRMLSLDDENNRQAQTWAVNPKAPTPLDLADMAEECAAATEEIVSLPQMLRNCFLARFSPDIADFTMVTLAKRHNCCVETIKNRADEAMDRIRNRLAARGFAMEGCSALRHPKVRCAA